MSVGSVLPATPASRLQALWLSVTVLVCLALGALALLVARQSRTLQAERARETTERMLLAHRDTVAARITSLGSWLVQAGTSRGMARAPDWAAGREVLVLVSDAAAAAPVHGRWLFTPDGGDALDPIDEFFELEQAESANPRSGTVLSGYRRLVRSESPDVRAGAHVRIARILVARGDLSGAIVQLEALSALPDGRVDGTPAALVGRFSRIALLDRAGRGDEATTVAREVRAGLDEGRWPAPEGVWQFYGKELAQRSLRPAPSRERLALSLAAMRVLADSTPTDMPTIVRTDAGPVLALARTQASGAALALLEPAVLLPASDQPMWLLDGDGRRLESGRARSLALSGVEGPSGPSPPGGGRNGSADPGAKLVTVPLGSSGLMLQAPTVPLEEPWHLRGDVMALAGAMVVIACVLAGSWGLLRGIRREAQLNALQSHFIAAVSHELRTPVTSLRYMADMLGAKRVAPESLSEYYAVLGRESRRLQSLIEGLLQFGRLEAGTTRLQRDRIDAWQFATATVQDFEAARDADGPRMRMVGADPGITVLGDGPALAVALRNLLDNAVKYSPDTSAVEVSCQVSDAAVRIRVRDFGLGLSAEDVQLVFRRFTRGSAAERTGAPGTGLGLALAQHIATVHGGALEVESAPGGGSVFTLRLPVTS